MNEHSTIRRTKNAKKKRRRMIIDIVMLSRMYKILIIALYNFNRGNHNWKNMCLTVFSIIASNNRMSRANCTIPREQNRCRVT